MKIRSLQDVVHTDLCAGCGICQTIAGQDSVQVQLDAHGFYRPSVYAHLPVPIWEEIRRVCPGIGLLQTRNASASRIEQLWGPFSQSLVGHATDEAMRWRGSSGGALSALLVHLLTSGHIECALHVGVHEGDPFTVSPVLSYTPEEVVAHAGARYAPSAPLTWLRHVFEAGASRVAIVGKPCDIAATRSYLRLHPEMESRVAALLSFFCAGVPSLLATDELLKALSADRPRVREFRYRGCGWPGRATAVTEDGQEHSMSYEESWGQILNRRVQFRCKLCPDGVGEFADIVCGDAWHTRDGYPDFEERPGQSLILARTPKGGEILKSAMSSGHLLASALDPAMLVEMQPFQAKRRRAIAARLLALKVMGKAAPRYEGFHLLSNARQGGVLFTVRQFGGMVYRSYQGTAPQGD